MFTGKLFEKYGVCLMPPKNISYWVSTGLWLVKLIESDYISCFHYTKGCCQNTQKSLCHSNV